MTVEIKKSFCHLCAAECGIKVTVENNYITKVAPDFDDPISQGYICEKSQQLIKFQSSPDRITSPLKKINGEFIPISWEQAIDEIAEQLSQYIHEPTGVMYMAPLSLTYNATIQYSYELMATMGVKYITNVYSYEKAATVLAYRYFFDTFVSPDRKNAQTLIVIGQNPWVTQHYPRARKILNDIKNNPARTLIVIDPVSSETAAIADHHLKLKSGTDAWLLSALIKLLIDENGVDYNFINSRTMNFDKVLAHFNKLDLTKCLENCGISYNQLSQIVDIIKSSNGVAIDCGNGICHSILPFTNSYQVILLFLITGNYQKSGSMVSAIPLLLDHNQTQNLTTKKTPVTNQQQLNGVMPAAAISDNLNFNCIIIDNCNPAARIPAAEKFKDTLSKVNLVIALDSFMTASTSLADYILPTPTFFERYECVNGVHAENGTLQLSNPPLTSSYAKSTTEIYELILEKLNLIDNIAINNIIEQYKTDRAAFYNTIIQYKTDRAAFYSCLQEKCNAVEPIIYYILRKTVGVTYKTPLLSVVWWGLFQYNIEQYDDPLHAIKITDELIAQLNINDTIKLDNKIIQTSKINLTPPGLLRALSLPDTILTDPYYQYVLQCGYRQTTTLNDVIKNINDPILEIAEADATNLGIVDTEQVLLETSLTSITITCKLVSNSQPGLLRIANHPIINQLTSVNLTSVNNVDYLNPQYKFVFANIRKINGNM